MNGFLSTRRALLACWLMAAFALPPSVGGAREIAVEPSGPCSRKTGFTISEIMYHPDDAATLNTEFVEIYNSNPFEEELSGYRLSGEIEFTFPDNTFLEGRSRLVIAKNATNFQARYNLQGVQVFEYGAPDGGNSLGRTGPLRLVNNSGGIVLEIEYDNDPPWPVGADGAGHSLVLVQASYGENDPRAWAASDLVGGSPGAGDGYGQQSLRKVCINEILAHTDDPQLDALELYNHANTSIDLSGCLLTDDPATNKFVIPAGTIVPARGYLVFDQTQLGFALSSAGETVYLRNASGQRLLDAVRFGGQENGVAIGRFPNGGDEFHRLATPRLGLGNGPRRIDDVVINEIMCDPISGDSDDEFVELHNQGGSTVPLDGWRLEGGVDYTFPPGAAIPAGGYVVVGRNAARLRTNYVQLTVANTFGDYGGSLANGGERLVLTKPDTVVDYTIPGHPVTNRIHIAVDEVTYRTGGQWPVWASGGGSSLERVDPRANPRFPTTWSDSDESGKAEWTDISVSGLLELGAGAADAVEGGLMGAGECLLDDVQVIQAGTDQVLNPDFNANLDQWVVRGAHERSEWVLAPNGYAGTPCLRLRASKRYDTGANRILGQLASNLVVGDPATIQAKARWLKGYPYLLLRIHGNYLEAGVKLSVPRNLGTPGEVNSRAVTNAAPSIGRVRHTPVLPAAGQSVVVSAWAEDPDLLSLFQLHYRIDPSASVTTLAMNDAGIAGDGIAGDGLYSATIPGQSAGTLVAFKVVAADAAGSPLQVFPGNTPDNCPRERECLVRFGDATRSTSFGIYRMWFTQAAIDDWEQRLVLSNEPIEGTFVHNDRRVIYNFSARYTGSYYHQGYSSPLSDCNYSMEMPPDDRLLGADNFNKLHAPGNGTFEDGTMQREQVVYWIARQLGLPWLYRRYVNVYVNGVARRSGWLMEDTQVPGADFLESYWPDDANGWLAKFSGWQEVQDAASGSLSHSLIAWAQLLPHVNAMGQLHPARERWTWARRAHGQADVFNNQPVLDLIQAADSGGALTETLLEEADMENWMRTLAVRHAVGDWDSFGCGPNGQNMYAYKPERGRWQLINWDANIVLGSAISYVPGRGLFPVVNHFNNDPNLTAIYNNPTFRRMYLRALKEICTDVLPGNYNPLLSARYNAFVADGLNRQSPDATFSRTDNISGNYDGEGAGTFNGSLRDWMSGIQTGVLARVNLEDVSAFSLTSLNHVSSSSNVVTLFGTAPLEMASIAVNGVEYPVVWDTVTGWTIQVVVETNGVLAVQGFNVHGQALPGFATNVAVTLTGPVEAAEDSVVINEILYNAAVPGTEFVELYNRSTNTAFNLNGWRFNGLAHTFESTVLRAGEYLVVDDFSGRLDLDGETLTLWRPVGTNGGETVVDRVRYETVAPWPSTPAGASLQLMDPAQDNRRAALWAVAEDTGEPPVSQTILDWGDTWKYRQGVNLDGTGWYLPGHADAAWPSGPSPLGLESSALPHPLQTTLTLGDLTYYFRKTFTFSGAAGAALRLTTQIDDGAVIYLDGVEIYRLRMPAGTPSYSTLTTTFIDNAYEEFSPVLPVALEPGPHTIAVEVHQTSSGSSDIVFGMKADTDYTDPLPVETTPGRVNSVGYTNEPVPALWLNEVMPQPVSGSPWVELYNAGHVSVDLAGFYLSDDFGAPGKWSVPAGTPMAAGEFRSVDLGVGTLTNHGSVLLSREVGGQLEVIDYLNYGPLAAGWSYGDYPDGEPCFRIPMYVATPGVANTNQAAPLDVRINEWMADNTYTLADAVDGDYEDWFELYNPGEVPVDMGGYFLTDDLSDPFQFEVPTGGKYTIPAKAHLLVWADNEPAQNNLDPVALHVGFALARSGEAIAVVASDGAVVDSVVFGLQAGDVSEGRLPDGGGAVVVMSPATPGAANQGSNSPPRLDPVPAIHSYPGEIVTFTATAVDAESAYQSLVFSLEPGAPAGATLTTNGNFHWAIPSTTAPGAVGVTVHVQDDGVPPLGDTVGVTLNIHGVPQLKAGLSSAGDVLHLEAVSVADHFYQVHYTPTLIGQPWLPVGSALEGDGSPLLWQIPMTNGPSGFYRLSIDPL